MPHCPNCGNQVESEHHYCVRCAYPLTDEVSDSEQTPPSGTAAGQQGFLSGRSTQYLNSLIKGEQELDPDSTGYANLSRDVGAALADFGKVAAVSDVNLLALLADQSSGGGVMNKDAKQLSTWEFQEQMMWMGLIRVPKLYDRTFGTEWSDELSERLSELVERAEELKKDDQTD